MCFGRYQHQLDFGSKLTIVLLLYLTMALHTTCIRYLHNDRGHRLSSIEIIQSMTTFV